MKFIALQGSTTNDRWSKLEMQAFYYVCGAVVQQLLKEIKRRHRIPISLCDECSDLVNPTTWTISEVGMPSLSKTISLDDPSVATYTAQLSRGGLIFIPQELLNYFRLMENSVSRNYLLLQKEGELFQKLCAAVAHDVGSYSFRSTCGCNLGTRLVPIFCRFSLAAHVSTQNAHLLNK